MATLLLFVHSFETIYREPPMHKADRQSKEAKMNRNSPRHKKLLNVLYSNGTKAKKKVLILYFIIKMPKVNN